MLELDGGLDLALFLCICIMYRRREITSLCMDRVCTYSSSLQSSLQSSVDTHLELPNEAIHVSDGGIVSRVVDPFLIYTRVYTPSFFIVTPIPMHVFYRIIFGSIIRQINIILFPLIYSI